MKVKILLISSLVSLAITACGGGSSGTDAPVNAETGDLKSNAIRAIGGSFDGSLGAVGSTINQNSSVGNTINDVATGGADQMGEDLPTDVGIQQEVQNWVSVSLGTDVNSGSTTTRDGNVITVDPDEAEMCREDRVFDQSSAQEVSDCIAFFRDVTVRLVATAEEAGVLTYLYQQQPVVSLGYAPNSESVELDLGGLKAAIDGIAALEINSNINSNNVEQITSPDEMSGSFKFTATETNSTEGQEAGSISYAVAKPIQIAAVGDGSIQNRLTMQTGTLFSISADAATGVGSLSIDLGAIAATGATGAEIGQMNLAGFTAQADVNPADGALVVRNFGLSKGPFSLSLNNEEVISATLGAFGFRVTEGTDMEPGELIIDGNMDLSIVLNQFAENEYMDGVVAMALDMMAPNGTSFSRAGNGSTQIGGAGPFTVTLGQTPDIGTPTIETVQVNSGECFTDLFEDSVAPSAEQCL
ncbi:MAG: hypothetical protein KTR35_09495 [Gammaproteobacteria bacterium]|nr:hypothetical protein [Gammaproteobacteria bacterium]